MAVLLSMAAALTYGAADFVGGVVTKRVPVTAVVVLSQAVGTVPFLALFPVLNQDAFSTGALAWGAAAGVGGATGVVLLYAGLAAGRMSVVAPITAVEAASVPVVFGMVSGERPGAVALAGVLVALVAVGLISSAPEPLGDATPVERTDRLRRVLPPGVTQGLGAGAAFGAFFIFLDAAGNGTGLWPLVGARVTSLSLVGVAVLVTRQSLKVPGDTWPAIAAAGILDLAANIFYLLATREGLLSLVAVITSMYPASTVLLARLWLGERMVRIQLVGLAGAGVAIVLIAGG